MTAVAWALAAFSALLLWAGITGQDMLKALQDAFGAP